MDVYRSLRSAEDQNLIKIDSYAVVEKGFDGRVRVKDQRRKGARAGVVVGALVGLVGGPAGVVAGAAAGGAAGYVTGNAVGVPKQTVDTIRSSLSNGESAIIAVVEDKYAVAVQKMEEPKAARIMNDSIPLLKDESEP
jgi:uncharacterized membrane protein